MSDFEQHQAEQQAMQWQARLSSDLLVENQRRAFEDWLAERPENAMAWRSVNDFWIGLDALTLDDVAGDCSAERLELPVSKIGKVKRSFHKTVLAVAASLLLTLSFAYQQLDYYLADYHTATGQQQLVILADGSTVQLNTASAISVDFSDRQRLITLHRGEAYFKVASDRRRPFVVTTDAGQVQALGTAFDVKILDEDRVGVTVFEHAVKVTTADGHVKDRLTEAEQMIFAHASLSAAMPANLQRAGAWHLQRMVFQDKPLAEVVAELERYRPGKILIVSDAINKLPITGVFDTGNTGLALQSISESLPVKVRKITDSLVLLSAK